MALAKAAVNHVVAVDLVAGSCHSCARLILLLFAVVPPLTWKLENELVVDQHSSQELVRQDRQPERR
eukprot:1502928-Rhodomonas_salina.2